MCGNKLLCEIKIITINQTAVIVVCHWENKFRLEYWLVGRLGKGSVHWREAQYVNIWGGVHWEWV